MSVGKTAIAGIDGGSKTLNRSQLERFGGRLNGGLLLPDDKGWPEAIVAWNGMVAKRPAVVIQPESAADVAAAVSFARNEGLLLSVKGGGHNIAGTALAEGGMTLDMSRMRRVSVDPEARTALVGPGARLGEVDAATQEHGLATVLGFVSETGVAGLTLGGGWGYLTRRFGWTVDNLEQVEIVTADGEIRTANREQNADLFWAVRGGGGNFGVVTRFEFRLHKLGPVITGGLIGWSAEMADEVLEAYWEMTSEAPRELTAAVVSRAVPPAPFVPEAWHGKPMIAMIVCYSGDESEAALRRIKSLPDPIFDMVRPLPYVEQQSMLDANEPSGLHRYWKTEFLPELSPGFLSAFREGALERTSPLSHALVFHLAGALNEHGGDDGAVDNRDAKFITGFSGTWPSAAPAEPNIAWVRTSWERIRGYSTGGNYVNFQQADDDTDRLQAGYRNNFQRLRSIKAKYDPDNLFRVNRNISPAA